MKIILEYGDLMIETEKENIVIYHNNCYDGITAAYVAWCKLKDTAIYLPYNYSDSAPEVIGKNIYIVDFSFKRDVITRLAKENWVVILDHHKTAEAELNGLAAELNSTGWHADIIFDMERSGAGIAWDYFFSPNTRHDLINYIEDRDLWRFKLESSREVNAWIQSWDIDLDTWIDEVAYGMETRSIESIIKEGESLLRQQSKLVRSICDQSRMEYLPSKINIGPYVDTSILMSEVCEELLLRYPEHPFSFYSFIRKDGKRQYGLRSRATAHPTNPYAQINFDVSIIAKTYGGGGHRNAAGFELEEK